MNDQPKFDDFKNAVTSMTREWVEKGGNVTCEFSTNQVFLAEKLKFLSENAPEGGRWVLYYCPTCVKHHGPETPFHVEIEGVV